MKNFTNLFLVGILIFGLGCKCSELSGEKKESVDIDVSAPTNSSAPVNSSKSDGDDKTDIEAAEPASFGTGDYTGTAQNQTTGTSGDILLQITSYDSQKNTVSAYFRASNGLTGEGDIGGIYNAQTQALSLFGTVSGGMTVIMSGKVSGRAITANYTIGNKENGFQKGTLSVSK